MMRPLDKDLDVLHQYIATMGGYIERSIDNMILALNTRDPEVIAQIRADDDIIDVLEKEIEQKCICIIARQNPAAKDLREITSVLKIITDLERIGDHCSDIAKLISEIGDEPYIKELIHIPQMVEEVKQMVRDVIDGYIARDTDLAVSVCNRDDLVDDLYGTIRRELEQIMAADGDKVKQGVALLLLAKYLERMADHTTNVGEWIIYNVTGRRKNYNEPSCGELE